MRKRFGVLVLLLALVAVDAGAVTYPRVTVAVTATLIFTAPRVGAQARVLVRVPCGGQSVYVGDAAVTTATGFEIASCDALGINMTAGDVLYGIVAGTTQVVHTLSGAIPQ